MAQTSVKRQRARSDKEPARRSSFAGVVDRSPASGPRLIALFLIALLLFNFPFLAVIDAAIGAPWTPVILFAGWAATIIAMALVVRGGGKG